MSATKSPLTIALSLSLLAGTALLAGCAQPASQSTTTVSSAPAPAMDTSTTTTYRRQ